MLALLALSTALALPAPESDTIRVQIEAYPVSWGGRVRDPYVGQDGRVWFVGQAASYLAVFDTVTKRFERIDISDEAHPHTVIVGPDGAPWYAGNQDATIVRIDPVSHLPRVYPMPSDAVGDPHTMVFDRAGMLWFTAQNGNSIGRLDPRSGEVRVLPSPTPQSRPYGILLDKNGLIWADLFGSDQIARVDPRTMTLTTVKLPATNARPRRIATTSDGHIWWGDYTRGKLGRLNPATGQITEYDNPGGLRSLPYAMTVDDRDRIWYVETGQQPNRLVAVDGRNGQVLGTWAVPGTPNTVRHMVFDPRSRSLWFGTDYNDLVRVRLDVAAPQVPRT